jgi:hypothetical protein
MRLSISKNQASLIEIVFAVYEEAAAIEKISIPRQLAK